MQLPNSVTIRLINKTLILSQSDSPEFMACAMNAGVGAGADRWICESSFILWKTYNNEGLERATTLEMSEHQTGQSVRFFNVDLNSEGIRSGILATKSDFSLNLSKELSESVDVRQSAYHRNNTPSSTNTPNSSFLGVSGSKESVIQRFFRRSNTRWNL
nr:expressed protein [Hymenolepis microstoma]